MQKEKKKSGLKPKLWGNVKKIYQETELHSGGKGFWKEK